MITGVRGKSNVSQTMRRRVATARKNNNRKQILRATLVMTTNNRSAKWSASPNNNAPKTKRGDVEEGNRVLTATTIVVAVETQQAFTREDNTPRRTTQDAVKSRKRRVSECVCRKGLPQGSMRQGHVLQTLEEGDAGRPHDGASSVQHPLQPGQGFHLHGIRSKQRRLSCCSSLEPTAWSRSWLGLLF